jgi:hypothetical protein
MWPHGVCDTIIRMSNLDPAPVASTRELDPALPDTAHEEREIKEVVERLTARFPHEQPERIRGVVDAAHAQFKGNPIRDFVPVFVERVARDTLNQPTP